jgi:2-polyprenyl-3-methyl-5-hydroxy-6-metoxy-1,4-benzoquinol methylase
MVLQEFFKKVVGFEREPYLVNIASTLLPAIDFCRVESLDKLNAAGKGQFDFVMTCTVLQHLTDDFCKKVLEEIKRLSHKGHILLIEKNFPNMVTENIIDGNAFISRARPVDTYAQWMKPYNLISVSERKVESTYERTFNQTKAGSCMLFRSPLLD